ncbi:polysaccharide deacetylase family protein [Terrimonas alba]|uniref:polysaccharide deacetylase family protein n=1 Tax=Terrimonas alba TaxID=3349636 RepID=UPI0035F41D0C
MKKYFIKTPWWLKKIYPSYLWSIDTKEKNIYLTFDDGPHAIATPFVLDQLKHYNAKATFFCIGKNVLAEPHIYKRILDEGHAVGNHTHRHLNGWKAKNEMYLADVNEAGKYIDSILFRPPYGRITSFQAKNINAALKKNNVKIIMWDVISGDFDESLTGEQCLQNVILNATSGSIVVMHDSQKAFARLKYLLPLALSFFSENGYQLKRLESF